MAMLHNKIARAQQDLTAAGAGPVAVEQFGIACLAECVARFRARQSLVAIGASGRLQTCDAAAVNMETLATTVQAATAPSARFLGRCLPKRAK